MQLSVLPDPATLAAALAAQLVADLQAVLVVRAQAQVVFSTGATPIATYAELRRRHLHALDWRRVQLWQMDEYRGLPPVDLRRFSTFLRAHLIAPLQLPHRLLTGGENAAQLHAYEAAIAAAGGLDLVLYGVGINGHLGFNEPGSPFDAPTRQVVLHASTTARIEPVAGLRPQRAVTLGLGVLNAARRLRVVAWGPAKRPALVRGLLQSPDPQTPLSSVQAHPDLHVFVDAAAAP